ncbi:ImmA/IrrE family metallo-endopeptidase [Devosia sp. BK]|uniref:ImmA/IrrE family metallo-endopeptidase n=1 Tax=Devosia sp. BK TaxID=2871706 RepID=UPI00293B5A06|nr:ImmA/IrrE family metallo-endopeptidase [Devosia sp. BK]MDV3251990.1 ImmA/IrrE family metallo-endopeptidase [Devosia sp. BK]
MARALINSGMLEWAIARAEMPVDTLAERLHVRPDQIELWLSGEERPTFVQAQKAAAILAIPFGYLYMQKPPREDEPIPDLRTVGGKVGHWDVNLRSLMTDILYKQEWYKDFRQQNGEEALPFVKKFSLADKPEAIAADMHAVLHGESGRPRTGTFENYLQSIMLAAEDAGIWVMRTGIVGNNTHRPLAVSNFRGLAVADPIVPLVLINGQDSKAAQIFTLAHELAHLWLGESGVSNVQLGDDDYGAHRKIEQHCNKVAAEFLTPRDEFVLNWRPHMSLNDQVDGLSRHFKVSRVVIARRAYDLGYVDQRTYADFYLLERRRWSDVNRDSGGDFFNTLPVRNGRRFTKSVISEAMRGTLLLRHAGSLLGIQPGKIRKMHERLATS